MGYQITRNYHQHTLLATMAISLFALIMAVLYIINGAKVCPLCLLQQATLVLIIIISYFGWKHSRRSKPKSIRWHVLIAFVALIGLLIALWQLYLQLNPSNHRCGLTAVQLLHVLPLKEALPALLVTQDCAAMEATLLGFPLTVYAIAIFIILLLMNLSRLYRKPQQFNNTVER